MKTKSEIRKEIKERLKNQNEAERRKNSLVIKKKLFNLPEFKKANVVMFYVSTEFEVDTRDMIDDALATGKVTAVPYVIAEEKRMTPSLIKDKKVLVKGPYGIYQPREDSYIPVTSSEIDLVVVPGVAFTRDGARLGRGGGFYDRFLKDLPENTQTIGIAFGLQVVSGLPQSERDIPVKKLITELG